MSANDLQAATDRLRSAISDAVADLEDPWCEELRAAWQNYTDVAATPLETSLRAIAKAINALPHGTAQPSVCLGGNGAAYDALVTFTDCTITDHRDGPRHMRAARTTVEDVEFYAYREVPR